MADLFITEYTVMGDDRLDRDLQLASEPAISEQVVDFTSGVTSSSAFNAKTLYVRLQSDTACHVKFGADPTADTTMQPLNADQEYFRRIGATGLKVSVIAAV